jgi:hypothetical protein
MCWTGRRVRNGLVLATALGTTWIVLGAEPDPWSGWSALRYRARATLLSGHVEMHSRAESEETIRFETVSTASFLGARIAQSRTTSWLDARTLLPLRHESVADKRARRYVFGTSGYTVERLVTKGPATEPLEKWDVTARAEYDYPGDDAGSVSPVFDYYGMLLHLARLDLGEPGDEAVVPVATSRGPVVYRIRVAEAVDDATTVLDRRSGNKKREIPVRQLRLRVTPADPSRGDEGFLRMEGETEMWVEARTKTLLRVSGKVPKVPGRVKIVLAEIG